VSRFRDHDCNDWIFPFQTFPYLPLPNAIHHHHHCRLFVKAKPTSSSNVRIIHLLYDSCCKCAWRSGNTDNNLSFNLEVCILPPTLTPSYLSQALYISVNLKTGAMSSFQRSSIKATNSANAIPCRCASQLLLDTVLSEVLACSIIEIYKAFSMILIASRAIMSPGSSLASKAVASNLIAHLWTLASTS